MRCSERLGSFSSSKVSSLDQRFRISAFVPVVLMGIQLELSTAARWGTGARTCGDTTPVGLGTLGGSPAWEVHASGCILRS